MAIQMHSSDIVYGLAWLFLFVGLLQSSYVQHNAKPPAYIPTGIYLLLFMMLLEQVVCPCTLSKFHLMHNVNPSC